jgi:predicted ATP-binding protein involved in virulence
LNNEADDPVAPPTGALDPAVARVLKMYAEDTQKKFETLDPLLSRINLFKKLMAQRFTTKTVSVDREHGIFVKSSSGEIPLDKLSSGEQHQLVLFFELLFEIKPNSLILIDEPELSLHVAWQKKFISDLISIISLNSFDVILATHSPQLISHWEDLVVELGDIFSSPDDG